MKTKLTIKAINAIEPGPSDLLVWDTDVKGFGCKVTPKGRKTFFFYYRTKDKTQRRPTIGEFGSIKPETARDIARNWAAQVAAGEDPSGIVQSRREAPTFAELADRYLSEYAASRKKKTSIENDRRLLIKKLVPALGRMKVGAITRAQISELHHRMRETPYEANRALSLLHRMFVLAERWGLRPEHSNPAANIDRYPERKRERFLDPEEIRRLFATLDEVERTRTATPHAVAAIRLLMLTGCRLSEILTLSWDEVDISQGLIRLSDSKTGAREVVLSPQTAEVLNGLIEKRDPDNTFVIEGHNKGNHLVNLQKPWRRIRQAAQLGDVRLHDLRHTYASLGIRSGLSLPVIGKLLGHTEPRTTARYAHLERSVSREAANLIGQNFRIPQKQD